MAHRFKGLTAGASNCSYYGNVAFRAAGRSLGGQFLGKVRDGLGRTELTVIRYRDCALRAIRDAPASIRTSDLWSGGQRTIAILISSFCFSVPPRYLVFPALELVVSGN